jgi:D-ribose pyranose/furanose isomerase RbsD
MVPSGAYLTEIQQTALTRARNIHIQKVLVAEHIKKKKLAEKVIAQHVKMAKLAKLVIVKHVQMAALAKKIQKMKAEGLLPK